MPMYVFLHIGKNLYTYIYVYGFMIHNNQLASITHNHIAWQFDINYPRSLKTVAIYSTKKYNVLIQGLCVPCISVK